MHAEMSQIAVISDNDNFAPCMFQSLCEIFGDCFGASVFLFTLPQKNTSVQNNHLRIHTMPS